MIRKYYTLLVKEPEMGWSPQFGDYVRSVVVQEQADMRDEGGWPKGTQFKIITTGDRQADIDAAVNSLNGAITTRGRAAR